MGRRNQKRDALSALNFYLKEIEPLTKSQVAVFDSDKHLMLHGCAGTGKTFISLYLALDDLQKEEYSRIVLVRSAVPTREMGFLPGTEDEKSKVYEAPYVSIMQELFSRGDNPYGQLKQKGVINFLTTSYIRGTTFNDSVIIVDECQNMTFHELDSIITRVGKNCRIIFCGDFFQSDLKNSGLKDFIKIINGMYEFDFIEFGIPDIVRSDFVRSYLTEKYTKGII
ncbi:PhoH family protein [Planktomarina sp.]|jgi:phosphate starvation-inducible protein PhoH|uniref:PhoH family protein n=1 Tax=Planktomarina sp. TaxID=2024851 RepID=UPI003260A00F